MPAVLSLLLGSSLVCEQIIALASPPFPGALTILSIFLSCQMVESLEGHWDTFIPFEGGHFPTESE